MSSPTERTLKHLRAAGYTVAIVEKWNRFAGIRQDLFGFIDILAIRPGETLAVQACAACDVSKRVDKIANHPNVGKVREAGWRIVVHGWRKPTKTIRTWSLREVDVS